MAATVDHVASGSTASSRRAGDTRTARHQTLDWRTKYANRMRVSDFFVLMVVLYGTQWIWLGPEMSFLVLDPSTPFPDVSYWLISGVVAALWSWALGLADSRGSRVIGFGPSEYIRVIDASLRLFGAIAIVAYAFKVDLARGYVLISLPTGVLALLVSRWAWRRWLMRRRREGEYSAKALLVGSQRSVADIAEQLRRVPNAGYRVVGACIPTGLVAGTLPGSDIPIMGNVAAVERAIAVTGADTVIVTSTDELPTDKVKEISWSLEAGRQHLVIAPSIADIAGPRIHTRPVAGLPLIHVETPRFSRGQQLLKRVMDLAAAAIGVVVISPVLLVLALAIKLDSRGPVLFHQTRIGLNGEPFTMLKFRSMVTNAESLLAELADSERDSGNAVLFKMKHDPRVTRVGRILRRHSLDELPQLFNVIGGSMSLVGPRPPLPSEVDQYEAHVHRRFLAKPGITGLWQVSGRSTLSWEDTVRLDLSYVENWSLLSDLAILFKTARVVVMPGETAH